MSDKDYAGSNAGRAMIRTALAGLLVLDLGLVGAALAHATFEAEKLGSLSPHSAPPPPVTACSSAKAISSPTRSAGAPSKPATTPP
jgi:hypothetical protein